MIKKILFLFLITLSFNTFSIASKQSKATFWFSEILKRQDSSFIAPSTMYLKIFIAIAATGIIIKKIINIKTKNMNKKTIFLIHK